MQYRDDKKNALLSVDLEPEPVPVLMPEPKPEPITADKVINSDLGLMSKPITGIQIKVSSDQAQKIKTMGLFSGWKPKTIAGKILKGAVTIGAPVAAAVTGVGAVAGAIAGTGAIAGVVGAGSKVAGVLKSGVTGVAKVGGVVGQSAVNLLTGTTKEQREMIQEQKQESRDLEQKIRTVEKLINAGATVEGAASKVGVPLSALAGLFGLPSEADLLAEQAANTKFSTEPITNNKTLIYAGLGLLALFILPKILKR